MENITRRTLKDEFERHLSPSSTQKKRRSETKKKKGGGFRFVYLPLNVTVDILSKKAINVFFPDGTNAFGEKREHCSLRFTDSAENIVPPGLFKDLSREQRLVFITSILCCPLQVRFTRF